MLKNNETTDIKLSFYDFRQQTSKDLRLLRQNVKSLKAFKKINPSNDGKRGRIVIALAVSAKRIDLHV